jgi:hypothetical protein
MIRIIFQEVKSSLRINYVCTFCLKRRSKTLTMCHTINPFNKNERGEVKTYVEVADDVHKALQVSKEKFLASSICTKCKRKE